MNQKNKEIRLIVQIPAYNEALNIAAVIDSIPRTLANIDQIVVIVVDDGSTDDTARIAKAAGADHVFRSKQNLGLGHNFRRAINVSLNLDADIIVNIDGDGQFDSTEIPYLIEPIITRQAAMVSGSRFINGDSRTSVPWLKRVGNIGFTWLISRITGQKFSDTQCGFRAYSREAALRLNIFGKFTYTQETFIDLAEKGLTIKEVPISVRYFPNRQSHISGHLFRYGWRSLAIIATATRDTKPMTFFGGPGLVSFGLGVLSGLYSLAFWLSTHLTTPIRTLLTISIFLVIFGLILIIFGLLADMLKRVKQTQEEILYKLKRQKLDGR